MMQATATVFILLCLNIENINAIHLTSTVKLKINYKIREDPLSYLKRFDIYTNFVLVKK